MNRQSSGSAPNIVEEQPRPDVRWVRHRPPSGPLPRWGLVATLVLVALIVGYRLFVGWVNDQMTPSALPGVEVDFVIVEGWSTNDVVASLGDAGVIDNPAMFRQWMRCPAAIRWLIDCPAEVEYSFQAGDYVLREHLGFEVTVALLNEGPLPEEVIRVTVPEGLTVEQTVQRLLREMPLFEEDELRAAMLSDRLRWEYGPTEHPDRAVEGLLFGDTYQLDEATVADELGLVFRMHQQFLRVIEQLNLAARAAEVGLTPYEAVVLASLIEEEALLDADRPRISRVIHNRLIAGWRLGIDASSRYAVGKTAGEPMDTEDLSVVSLWNTRVVTGLPPTPISSPGRASLEAALEPDPGPWMYYVRTDEGGVLGAHSFVTTSSEFKLARRVCIEKDLGCG
ncbi:MAG: endolytic transglycosylase MltG [Acidimicrobiales bacterium]|nr:endolytic transglycosylase MltG [Acidimicrobiales bacterium]